MVDTETLSRRAWEQIAADYGQTISDDLYGRMLGIRTTESAVLARDELALPLSVDELIARKTAVFLADLAASGVPVMPGLLALLDALDARGLPWAVATSTPRAVAAHILGQMGLAERCGALAGGDEVAQGKPSPELYLLAAERLGVDPAACLALEDTPIGCAAAAAAGACVLVVPTEMTRDAAFPCAHRLYPSLTEVAATWTRCWATDNCICYLKERVLYFRHYSLRARAMEKWASPLFCLLPAATGASGLRTKLNKVMEQVP